MVANAQRNNHETSHLAARCLGGHRLHENVTNTNIEGIQVKKIKNDINQNENTNIQILDPTLL